MKDLHRVVSEWKQSQSKFPYPGTIKLLKGCFRYGPPASADVSFEALLDVVIEHVGYATREVFLAMIDFEGRMEYHNSALSLGYKALRQVVEVIAYIKPYTEMDISHRPICLHLLSKTGDIARWQIDFRSPCIAKRVVQRLGEEGENKASEVVTFLSLSRGEGASLARWFFEPLPHRAILTGPPTLSSIPGIGLCKR